jgi:hypothetical protein
MLHIPNEIVGDDELAAQVAEENQNYNQALVKSVLEATMRKIQHNLIN